MRAAEQLRENRARSTLQTLDLEAAFGSSLFTGSFLYDLPDATPAAAAASVSSVHQIPIHASDPDRTRSRPHLMAGNGAEPTAAGSTFDDGIAFAVGTSVAGRPPHRSGRAGFPHPAPTSGA